MIVEPGWTEYVFCTLTVATKNDGLIQPDRTLWKDTDSWTPTDLQSMEALDNYYYSDTEPGGGWNHSEMMRYTRVYQEDDGTPLTPLRRNSAWITQMLGD